MFLKETNKIQQRKRMSKRKAKRFNNWEYFFIHLFADGFDIYVLRGYKRVKISIKSRKKCIYRLLSEYTKKAA